MVALMASGLFFVGWGIEWFEKPEAAQRNALTVNPKPQTLNPKPYNGPRNRLA